MYVGDFFSDIDDDITIKRGKFNSLCKDIFEKTIELTQQTLDDCAMLAKDIDEVLLVGGSTRIPKVRQRLRDLFPGKNLNHTFDADEAIAYGAAIRAAQIDNAIEADTALTEATPRPRGATMMSDRFSVVIPPNSSALITKKEHHCTAANNQTPTTFNVDVNDRIKDA